MALEIERKFLVLSRSSPLPERAVPMCQGYLTTGEVTVRVRVAGERAFLTIKSDRIPPGRAVDPAFASATKAEFEYPIPAEDAADMLAISDFVILKTRYYYPEGFEHDVFGGTLTGLELIEFEGADPSLMPPIPSGVTVREVTGDRRFSNAALAKSGLPEDIRRLLGLDR
jgi:CYTH domain-containing protein